MTEPPIDYELLDFVAENIPLYPPSIQDGDDVTVSDLYPALTEQELDYVMAKYKGSMKR
jgi:hypothetical protein